MDSLLYEHPEPIPSPLRDDTDAKLPAAAYLRYKNRADGWSAGRQAACLAHLADNGIAADAVRSVGMSSQGSYALRRTARGYAFNLGWEAALIIARRIVVDDVMTAAIRGEQSRWVREDGVTTYTRQNTKLSLTLLDRVNPATALPEVIAVATCFDSFLQLIDDGVNPQELWEYFFDKVLLHEQIEARTRVRVALQLSEESGGFEDDGGDGDGDDRNDDIEYKSMDGAPPQAHAKIISHEGTKTQRVNSLRTLRALREPEKISPEAPKNQRGCACAKRISLSKRLGLRAGRNDKSASPNTQPLWSFGASGELKSPSLTQQPKQPI
jgi:hypothetical protein